MSMFECYICGGAIGFFCHCKEPALSEEHANKIREKRNSKNDVKQQEVSITEVNSEVVEKKKIYSTLSEAQIRGYMIMAGFDIAQK